MSQWNNIKEIDGYVTKTDLYKLINRFAEEHRIGPQEARELCSTIENNIPTSYLKPEDVRPVPYDYPTLVNIGNHVVHVEPFILKQSEMLDEMTDTLRQIDDWLYFELIPRYHLLPQDKGRVNYFSNVINRLCDEYTQRKL